MILSIAWRNVWRSKARSLVVIFAIMIGLWAGIFIISFSYGMNEQRTRNIIQKEISHIQIHDSTFTEERSPEYAIDQSDEILSYLASIEGIQSVAPRTITDGMIQSARGSSGVQIQGVYPDEENNTTQLASKLYEGEYFPTTKRTPPIVISKKLSEKLKKKVRKDVVLTFQDKNGDLIDAKFRIVGLYESMNSLYDQSNVFVKAKDLQAYLAEEPLIHEIAILLDAPEQVDEITKNLKEQYPKQLVRSWKTLSPDLEFVSEAFDQYIMVFMFIIMLALAFGIINTMLMAVLERVKELGMLMAIGMNRIRIFMMIMMETLFMSLVGGPLGLFLAWATVSFFKANGINLGMFKEGLNSYGMEHVVYTDLASSYYFTVGVMVIFTAILSSIYPAIKALQLNPIESIRKI